MVAETDGLSFAHLQEVLPLSGLLAIGAGRRAHNDDDLIDAARTVRCASDDASRGFPPGKPEVSFGQGYLHACRRNGQTE